MSNLPNQPMGWATGPAMNPQDLARIAKALERIADVLEAVTNNGRVIVEPVR